uniref:Uncharacterized protein n=1 Tax=Acrobeloides nanus TaxID=290746 RepID=A0A914CP14_9BILA
MMCKIGCLCRYGSLLERKFVLVKPDVVGKQLVEAFIKHNNKAIQHDELIAFIANTFGIKFGMRPEQVKEIVGYVQKELNQSNCKTDVKKAIVEMVECEVLKMI